MDWQPLFPFPTLDGTDLPSQVFGNFFPGFQASVSRCGYPWLIAHGEEAIISNSNAILGDIPRMATCNALFPLTLLFD